MGILRTWARQGSSGPSSHSCRAGSGAFVRGSRGNGADPASDAVGRLPYQSTPSLRDTRAIPTARAHRHRCGMTPIARALGRRRLAALLPLAILGASILGTGIASATDAPVAPATITAE